MRKELYLLIRNAVLEKASGKCKEVPALDRQLLSMKDLPLKRAFGKISRYINTKKLSLVDDPLHVNRPLSIIFTSLLLSFHKKNKYTRYFVLLTNQTLLNESKFRIFLSLSMALVISRFACTGSNM